MSDVDSLAAGEVIERNVHPAVVGAGRIVVDPHRLAVAVARAVSAGGDAPIQPIGGAPHANAGAAASGGDVSGEPKAERVIVNDDRVSVVRSVPAAEGGGLDPVEGCAAVYRRGDAGVAAGGHARVIVLNDERTAITPDHAFRMCHMRPGLVAGDDVDISSAVVVTESSVGLAVPRLGQPAGDHLLAGQEVLLLVDVIGVDFPAIENSLCRGDSRGEGNGGRGHTNTQDEACGVAHEVLSQCLAGVGYENGVSGPKRAGRYHSATI